MVSKKVKRTKKSSKRQKKDDIVLDDGSPMADKSRSTDGLIAPVSLAVQHRSTDGLIGSTDGLIAPVSLAVQDPTLGSPLGLEVAKNQSRSPPIEFSSGVIRTKNTPDATSGISSLQAEKTPEPYGSRAAGSKSMQIDDEEPKVNVNELGDRLRQTALDSNDFRHRDLDSTSEESFGRPVVDSSARDLPIPDNAKDIEAQSLQFKLKRVIEMNLTSEEKSSILSMLLETDRHSNPIHSLPVMPIELVKHPTLNSFNQKKIVEFLEEYDRYLLDVKNNHPQRPKTEQDCVSTPLLRRISDHLGKAMCDLSPEEVRVWIRENSLEDQKLSVEEIKTRFKHLCMNPSLAPKEMVNKYNHDFHEIVRKMGMNDWFNQSMKTRKLRHTLLLEGIRPTCLKEQVTNMILTHGKPEKHHSASYLFKVCMEEAIRATPYLRFISKLLKC